jgi:hypothetical protein
MKHNLPLVALVMMTLFMWSALLIPVQAQPAGWSGDGNLAFQMEINGISIADSDAANPIAVGTDADLNIELRIDTGSDIILKSGAFMMQYLGFPIINQAFPFGVSVPSGTTQELMNESLPLGSLLSVGGLPLVTGTINGTFSFVYSLPSSPDANITVSDFFILRLGETGFAAVYSVTGLITVGFTLMSVFGLLMALDDFQQGILAASKVRGAESAADVGIFPRAVVLRRHKKDDSEKIDRDDLVRRVAKAAKRSWDKKRCPRCGKKWKEGSDKCSKCGLKESEATEFLSKDIGKYAPKALKAVPYGSKVPVGKFAKRLKLKPEKAGALAAALTEMGVFQTKSVKVPLKKVAFSGMTLAGLYWSWMQLLYGGIPSWVDVLLTTALGLVVSVLIGYCMNFLARMPELGYE